MLHTLELSALWVAFIACALILVCALVALLFPFDFDTSQRRTYTARYVILMVGLIVATAGAIGTIAAVTDVPRGSDQTKSTANRSSVKHHPRIEHFPITFITPKPEKRGHLPSVVHCIQPMIGSGKIPPGYSLVIGNAIANSNNYFFVPVDWPSDKPGKWTATGYFGSRSDGGSKFKAAAVVIPNKLKTYLVDIWNFQRKKGAYLAAPGLPPAPAYIAGQNIVRRSKSGTGCSQ